MKTKITVLIFSILIPNLVLFAQKPIANTLQSEREMSAHADAIISQLTLDEKLAQLTGIRSNELMIDGQLSIEQCRKLIPNGIGHISQFASSLTVQPEALRNFVRDLQHYLVTQTRSGIPAIFHEELITGFATLGATTFPQQIGMGCTWNPVLIEKNTRTTSRMMRQVGGTQALSPMMDICNNANWGRMEESFGEDPYLTSRMGLAFVNGLQGNDLRTGVAATTKHFAGYGGKVEDMREFYEETLMPHEVLFKLGGVRNVMPGYHAINGVPAAADKWLLSDVLRNHLQFDGVVVSDYGAVRMVNSRYKYAKDFKEAAVMAIQAGNDIELERAVCTPFFKEALEEGIINIEVINRAVKRSLIMKSRLGLFDKKAFVSEDNNLDFDSPEQRQLAYESASQSIVLLKNNGVLPLKKSIKKIALVGPNATAFQSLLGDYTYQSMRAFFWNTPSIPSDPQLVTLFDGLKAKVGKNITIECERGCDWSDPMEMKLENFGDARVQDAKRKPVEQFSTPDWKKAMEIAKESDVVIAAMGENLYLCGEGRERNGIKLAGDQEEFVKKIAAQGKPVILVIFGGRPQVISNLENHCAAIVQAWFPGEEGGNAVADILLGNINPTGKLCVSYPKHDEKKILSYSRGYDEQNMPHYPFGYGLSYTTYKYSDFKITEKANLSDQWITISCKVKNTGKVDGAEIVQLYVSAAEGLPMAYRKQQLKGFQRIELKKGEEKTIVFKVSPKQFASFIDRKWRVSSGGYTFKIGASSTDIKFEKKIELTGSSLEMEERKYFSH